MYYCIIEVSFGKGFGGSWPGAYDAVALGETPTAAADRAVAYSETLSGFDQNADELREDLIKTANTLTHHGNTWSNRPSVCVWSPRSLDALADRPAYERTWIDNMEMV
jgi:hypothetical protein